MFFFFLLYFCFNVLRLQLHRICCQFPSVLFQLPQGFKNDCEAMKWDFSYSAFLTFCLHFFPGLNMPVRLHLSNRDDCASASASARYYPRLLGTSTTTGCCIYTILRTRSCKFRFSLWFGQYFFPAYHTCVVNC